MVFHPNQLCFVGNQTFKVRLCLQHFTASHMSSRVQPLTPMGLTRKTAIYPYNIFSHPQIHVWDDLITPHLCNCHFIL